MAINTQAYIERLIKIQAKDGKIMPLILNEPQKKMYEVLKKQHESGKPMRIIVLKARQMGFSTLSEALIFKRTITKKGVKSGIVAHKEEASHHLYKMSQRMYEQLPNCLKPVQTVHNTRELVWGALDSQLKVMTAGAAGMGRADTFQNLHLSEFAFWPGDKKLTLAGAMQCVPNMPDTMVIIESTANGFDTFKEMWDSAVAGESEFAPIFCAWWEMQEYRMPYDGFSLTRQEEVLKQRYQLDYEQIAWRRWCIQNNCAGDVQLFQQEYPACPEEAFLSTGECIFEKELIYQQLAATKGAIKRVKPYYDLMTQGQAHQMLSLIEMRQEETGSIFVYEEPIEGVPYVIGADTAGEGSDWFVAQVVNNITGKQAAVMRRQYDEDLFAYELMALGYWYHTALIGVEANFSTYPIKLMERFGYPKQYLRQSEDRFTNQIQHRWGVKTTAQTRPVMIAQLVQWVRDHPDTISDVTTLREMLTFVKNERGKPQALQGKHDDCVMALAIAHYIRPQQEYTKQPIHLSYFEKDIFQAQMNDVLNFGI